MLETRDLYDLDKNLTGEIVSKGDAYPSDRKILVVLLFIENSNNKFLIQKRCDSDKWAFTCGHPKSGENSLEGIITETKEELGIDISEENIKLINCASDELVFVDMYYLNMDLNLAELSIQKEELSEVKYVSLEEIYELILKNEFFIKHIDKYHMLLEYKGIKLLKT